MTDKKPDWIELGKKRMAKLIQPRPTDSCLATRMFDFVDWFAKLAEERFNKIIIHYKDRAIESEGKDANNKIRLSRLEAENKRIWKSYQITQKELDKREQENKAILAKIEELEKLGKELGEEDKENQAWKEGFNTCIEELKKPLGDR